MTQTLAETAPSLSIGTLSTAALEAIHRRVAVRESDGSSQELLKELEVELAWRSLEDR